ncbi:TonB-dependent receptor family protein [Cognatilysobacter lacus]|uniref:TonB-dependent receptor n=1 Tax=Cognatilysobacter lacus TaxID=1643323 RepID=A0A5D8Z9B5_9GAMM|nr:TonB-dependent receptor [Lysobacter lacus]TZF90643.1 TonB-dependent receptor [Lysobacter lacus]
MTRPLSLCLLAVTGVAQAQAQTAPPPANPATLDRVQVVATRAPRAIDRTPAAVDVLQGRDLDTSGNGASLSEKLAGVPGVLARTRQNWAQDEQISIRGFGTRASFGIRSVRLYVDGIPATMPDGQGQVSHFPLGDATRIEVLRGPFAALYGNGAGGVVLLDTDDGGAPGRVGVQASVGSFDTWRVGTNLRGATGDVDYAIGASRFSTEGYRDHSAATRSGLDAKLSMPLGAGRVMLVANAFESPDVLDPQGLTRAQVDSAPRQASAGALRFNTRKSARQAQLGAIYELGGLHVLAYGGRRRIQQVLSTPPEAQRSPLSAGGWIDLDAPFGGVDARWTSHHRLAARPFDVVLGLDVEQQRQSRRGYENFVGSTVGVRGAPRQDQQDRVRSIDPYVQATWDVGGAWSVSGGVRASRVSFNSRDAYVRAGNPDDSGRVSYAAVSPVIGATWGARPGVSVYGSVGRGFETPTFNELGYRSDGGSGPNFLLKPMRMRNAELGVRLDRRGVRGEVALFESDTRDELVVNSSAGGRTTFRNAGPTRRRGVEAALRMPLGDAWHLDLSGTWLDAEFRSAFPACTGNACRAPVAIVPAGTSLPGVPGTQTFAALRRGGDTGLQLQLDAQHVAGVAATTAGDVRTDGYTVVDASVGWRVQHDGDRGRVYLGIANLLDRRYVGSVIVNDANGRYFEPAAERALTLGVEWNWVD